MKLINIALYFLLVTCQHVIGNNFKKVLYIIWRERHLRVIDFTKGIFQT